MRERDLNRNFNDENELRRIKTILFPKKQHTHNISVQIHQETTPVSREQIDEDDGGRVRAEIEKLRQQIMRMLSRGGGQHQSRVTERAYLDGIGKLTKELRNSVGEVRQVFDEFLLHLPTRLVCQPRSYTHHYHYSLLLQNVAWQRLTLAIRVPLAAGMQAIIEQAQQRDEIQRRVIQAQKRRQERNERRRWMQMNRALQLWRVNAQCLTAKERSQEYLRDFGIDGEQKLTQNLLNLPLLTLMLEQLGRETADISELLLIDPSAERGTKYLEQGLSALNNSSLQTVTQRSLLQSDSSNIKFSRFQITLGASLTNLCVRRGQILFVSSLAKSAEYGQADNLCYWQSLNRSSPPSLRGGAIFYPIFDSNRQCIAVLRQYFYEGTLTALPTSKLDRICTFLQLANNLDQRMRVIAKEKEYQRKGYYMKTITLLRKVECAEDHKEAVKMLQQELKKKFEVEKLVIYRVESSGQQQRELILKRIWGQCEENNSIITLAYQLLKQQNNYIYLEDRLVVYANQTIFDLRLPDSHHDSAEKGQILPIQLISKALSKMQVVIMGKERASRLQAVKQAQLKKIETKKAAEMLKMRVEETSLIFMSGLKSEQNYEKQINAYLALIKSLLGESQSVTPIHFLELTLSKTKKEKHLIKISQDRHDKTDKIKEGLLKVIISDMVTLHFDFKSSNKYKQLESTIITTLALFMKNYLSMKQQEPTLPNFQIKTQTVKPSSSIISREQKKKWELSKLLNIYDSFQQTVQQFTKKVFRCESEVTWQKEKPSFSNLEDWKHSLYRVLQNSENVTIQIKNKNPILSRADYKCLRALTSQQIQSICQQSLLTITANRYRSKNIYENSFMLSLPVYFHSEDQQSTISPHLQYIRSIFMANCKQFASGVAVFNQNLMHSAAKTIILRFDSLQEVVKKEIFTKIKERSKINANMFKNIEFFMQKLDIFTLKLQNYSFNKVCLTAKTNLYIKKLNIIQHKPISRLCISLNKALFGQALQKIKQKSMMHMKLIKSLKKIEQLCMKWKSQMLICSLQKIFFMTNQRSKASHIVSVISNLQRKACFVGLRSIKRVQQKKQKIDQTFVSFEKCSSIAQIKAKLLELAPDFLLKRQVDSEQYIILHKPKGMSQDAEPLSMGLTCCYQSGPEGQFVWHYNINETDNSFVIKDKLNTLSKCLQISLGNCRKTMASALHQCSSFRGSWMMRIKSRFMRLWANKSHLLQMVQRNKLNDSLYQMGIEGKTIRQKLKAQQKLLRSHTIQNQDLLKRQEYYRQGIADYTHQIACIEQNQIKLYNARSVYHSLHRRGVLKGIFLLWRTNSSELTVKIQQKRLKQCLFFARTAAKSISSLFVRKNKEYFTDFYWKLSQIKRKPAFSPKAIEKIEVMFEDRGSRLVTFQSQLEQQENFQQQSNRSDRSHSQFHQTKRQFDLSRSPLQRVQLSADEQLKHGTGAYRLNPKTLKFLKRMGKLQI